MTDTHESNFDIYIHGLLKEAGIDAEYQHTSITKLNEALSTASKNQTGEKGMPDFIAVVNGYVLVIENKADRDKLCLRDNDGSISLSVKATQNYALNGALFYAKKILAHGAFTKIFAFGNAGDSKHHTLRPLFVGTDTLRELKDIETFGNFSPENIERYYRLEVKGETPPEELKREEIRGIAKTLHQNLRNYGNLGTTEKPLVVAGILLALQAQKFGFSLKQLVGDETETDGDTLYKQIENTLRRAQVSLKVKLKQVLDQFSLIQNRPILNTRHEEWEDDDNPKGKTPLKVFAEYINKEIYSHMESDKSPYDYLGRFYMEFIRYTGGDSQSLGVVITPHHITELFCDLVDLKADDVIFDAKLPFLIQLRYRVSVQKVA